MSSIKKNIGLQTLYQIIATCMPLITAPYLARKLGASQLGIFSFTSSIVAYFVLFAMLGTVNYGTRSISSVNDNVENRSKVFIGIFSFQFLTTVVLCIFYFLYISFFCENNKLITLIQGITLLSCVVDVSWLFWGVEDFQITVELSLIIKVVSVVLILLFVKKESDLWIYTLIMTGGPFVTNVVLFSFVRKYVNRVCISIPEIKGHVAPNLILFLPLFAMTVYHTMDKTMLGAISTFEQSGFYYNSDKIVQIPLMIVNGIGTVMLPYTSRLIEEKRQKEADDTFIITLEWVLAISIALAFGIAAISSDFVPLFFGDGFEACIGITIVFTPILPIKGLSTIARTQYLIPMKMEKEITKSVIVGAIVNLFLNILFIPRYGAIGATIATVISELVACIFQFISLREKSLGIRLLLVKSIIYIILGSVMYFVVRLVSLIDLSLILKLLLEIIVGAFIYLSGCLLYWIKAQNKLYRTGVKPLLNKLLGNSSNT